MRKLTTLVAVMLLVGTSILMPTTALAGVDSFFDVFFDVTLDPQTRQPIISAHGTLTDASTVPPQTSKVSIEIVALSLVSSRGPNGSTRHQATLSYNIGSSGQDGVRGKKDKPNTAYAELEFTVVDQVKKSSL